MSIKGKRRKPDIPAVSPQTSPKPLNRFNRLITNSYSTKSCFKLYDALRQTIPIIDSAIYKIVRLTCGFRLQCEDKRVEGMLREGMENIPVGANGMGLYRFISGYFEQLLTYGTAVGEMVTDEYGMLCGLYNAPLYSIEMRKTSSPFIPQIFCISESGEAVPVRDRSLILLSALNPEPDSLWGTSLLRGLPFVADILAGIFNSIGKNWERFGDLRYAVTYKPSNDPMDKAYARERAEAIANEWSKAVNSDEPRDFVAIGDVSVSVIGADSKELNSEIPVKQMMEQIVAKTGLPPFMLGLSWSTTERMSTQQADIFTSEVEAYRTILEPVIMKIVGFWMGSRGLNESVDVIWNDVTIQDVLETARADYFDAQTEKIRSEINAAVNN